MPIKCASCAFALSAFGVPYPVGLILTLNQPVPLPHLVPDPSCLYPPQGLYPPPAIRLLSIIITRSISILVLIISSALYSLKLFFYLNFIGLFRTSCLSALTPTLLRHHFHHHRHKPHTLHTFGGVETQAKEGIFFSVSSLTLIFAELASLFLPFLLVCTVVCDKRIGDILNNSMY